VWLGCESQFTRLTPIGGGTPLSHNFLILSRNARLIFEDIFMKMLKIKGDGTWTDLHKHMAVFHL